MLIDHVAAVYRVQLSSVSPWLYLACRMIGRLAFPLFVFGVAEGVRHTKSPQKYALRMFIFALVSQIPFSLMQGTANAYGTLVIFGRNVGYSLTLSVMVPLFLGLVICLAVKEKNTVWGAFALIAAYAIDKTIGMDYGLMGVLFILAVYLAGEKKLPRFIVMLAFPVLFYFEPMKDAVMQMAGTHVLNLTPNVMLCLSMMASALLVLFYNGKQGKKLGVWGYFFYPVHLIIILVTYYITVK